MARRPSANARASKSRQTDPPQRGPATAPAVHLKNRSELRDWLLANHAHHPAFWLVYDKKSSTPRGLTYDDIVEECLCFGWIDSLPGRVDDARTKLYLAPRKPRSVWSALNKRRVATLIDNGLMTPAGLAKITAAQRDGSWDALNAVADVDRGQLPDDFAVALRASKKAAANFETFPPGVKRQIVQWIITAKQPTTRADRIRTAAAMASLNLRASDPTARRNFLANPSPRR